MSRDYPQTRRLQGIEFKLLAPLTAQRARFSFAGRFQDREVTWDAPFLLSQATIKKPGVARFFFAWSHLPLGTLLQSQSLDLIEYHLNLF